MDGFIRSVNLPAAFVYTGNFYENMILRGHVRESEDGKGLDFRQPIIQANTRREPLTLPFVVFANSSQSICFGYSAILESL